MNNSNQGLDALFTSIAQANQAWYNNLLSLTTQQEPNPLLNMYQQFMDNTKLYLTGNNNFYDDQLKMWQDFFKNVADTKPVTSDKRFSDPDWIQNPFFACLKQSYFAFSKQLLEFIDKADIDDDNKYRIRFFMNQYLDAIAPSNFPLTNPQVLKGAVATNGKSLLDGMQNMLHDLQSGYIRMTDESKFAVGDNLAATKGAVVFKNELIELIQYTATTTQVREIPLLIIPPCINKYYILDLQEHNSYVKYLVDQGYTVYLVSWKSADKEISKYSWEDYASRGAIEAIRVCREISGRDKINTLGYCIGGIILTTAALYLKMEGHEWINSMTHLTAMLDHSEPGDIQFFIGRDLIKLEETKALSGGIMSGRIIAQTFSALRANELIWNYWVNNYLMGKTPEAFDILYWNNDVVDLPIPMHSFLLERMYANNDLVNGKIILHNKQLDVRELDYPMYLFAAQKDHIVPWVSAYKTTKLATGKIRFVLGASGHTAGVINPASSDKRNYWTNDDVSGDSETWFKHAKEMPGSWWKDYSAWLGTYSGELVKVKKSLGSKEFKPLFDAPGEYIKTKAMTIIMADSI